VSHKLRNRVHEMVERLDMDADGLVGEPVAALILEALGREPLCPGLLCGRLSVGDRCRLPRNGGARRGRRHPLRSREAIEFADEIDVVARRSCPLISIASRIDLMRGELSKVAHDWRNMPGIKMEGDLQRFIRSHPKWPASWIKAEGKFCKLSIEDIEREQEAVLRIGLPTK
jgi:hypothetical protein